MQRAALATPRPSRPLAVDQHHEDLAAHWRRARLTRRSALRGALIGAGAIALVNIPSMRRAFAWAGGTSGPSGAVLVGRHVAFPNERGNDPTNAMRITTQVIFPDGRNVSAATALVRFGTDADYGSTVPADVVNLSGVVPNAPQGALAGNQFYVKALLSGLRPGTTYHYRVELSDGTVTGDGTFTTAPDRRGLGTEPTEGIAVPEPFTFTSFGDHGTNTAPTDPAFAYAANVPHTWPAGSFDDGHYHPEDPVLAYDPRPAATMTALVAAQNPAFHLVNGDVSYADPSGTGLPADNTDAARSPGLAPAGANAFDPYVWDVYLAQIEASASRIPWMVTTGNHDMEAIYGNHGYGGHLARLDLPQNGPSTCPSVYSFVYGNVGIVSVDANDLSHEIATNTGYSGGAQRQWVDDTLAAWRQDSTIDFVVMFMHHCAFTTGAHPSDLGVRSLAGELADRYEVDLVLSGHNHQVERTNPIRGNTSTMSTPDGTAFDARVGTTYLTIGSAGRPRYSWQNGAGPVDVTGATDRYRQHDTGAGAVTSYANVATSTGPGATGTESCDWSQMRYLDYALARMDVVPAPAGSTTTMTVTVVADGDRRGPGGVVIDQVTLRRTAGGVPMSIRGAVRTDDVSAAPIVLAAAATLVVAGASVHASRSRSSPRGRADAVDD